MCNRDDEGKYKLNELKLKYFGEEINQMSKNIVVKMLITRAVHDD